MTFPQKKIQSLCICYLTEKVCAAAGMCFVLKMLPSPKGELLSALHFVLEGLAWLRERLNGLVPFLFFPETHILL